MEGPDLVAIVLLLAVVIGCVNHLWIRLPPAIAMLAGSLLLSLIIVSSDRALHPPSRDVLVSRDAGFRQTFACVS
jgi:hypothetical protein